MSLPELSAATATPPATQTMPALGQIRLGLAMWSHKNWQHSLYPHGTQAIDRLASYANTFNTVEGNTTFYATPPAQTVLNWQQATPKDFRFTFKLPRNITHQKRLQHCQHELTAFFNTMTPLMAKTGLWKIQLPAQFGPQSLSVLTQFLTQLPQNLPYGVEVRHPEFFAKGKAERAFNRLLMTHNCNRIMMDSRPLFALPALTPAIIDAQQKKPRVPVHAIATADQPVVRFIGQGETLSDAASHLNDEAFFQPWLRQLAQWLAQGKAPYLFVHTPNNDSAPELAIRLYQHLQHHIANHIKLTDMQLPPTVAVKAVHQMEWEW